MRWTPAQITLQSLIPIAGWKIRTTCQKTETIIWLTPCNMHGFPIRVRFLRGETDELDTEFCKKLFRIQPAREREVVIIEPHTFLADVIRNKLWYRGDSAELEQYFKKTARWDVEKARFWAATAQGSVRKMHSGIVSTVVDRYKDIVLADMDAVTFGEGQLETEEIWKKYLTGPTLTM